jgi:hypothetical protein
VRYNATKRTSEAHRFTFEWNLERLVSKYDKDSNTLFKHMETARYKKHLTYFGDYQIRWSLAVDMNKVRMVEQYLVGKSMIEGLPGASC